MRKTTYEEREAKTLYAVSGSVTSNNMITQKVHASSGDSLKEIHAELMALLDELEEVANEL